MISYGLGYIGQGAAYAFISTYLVLFLTDCVGLGSTTAGTISSLALFVEVAMGMLIGNISDSCTSKMGRRRPFILFAALTMLPVLAMLYHTIKAKAAVLFVYYLIFGIMFRISFTCFEIPNNALGAEVVSGYDERTKLRTLSRFFSIIGNGIGYICPLLVLDWFGNDTKMGWQMTGIVIGATCLASWSLSFIRTSGIGMVLPKEHVTKKSSHLKEIGTNYLELLHLKPTKLLVIYKGAFTCAFAFFNVATLYYLQYSVGIGKKYSSYIYAVTILIFFIMVPLVSKMALAMGKVNQQIISMGVCAAGGIVVFFIAPGSIEGAIIYMVFFAAMQTSFWQLSSAIFYDVIEVDEYANNKRREGDLMSLVSVLGTLISAIMVQIFGIALDMTGYNPNLAVQPDSAVTFLNAAFILIPAICLLIGAGALKAFPINKKTFASLQEVLKLRKAGEDYSMYMEDIDKIMG